MKKDKDYKRILKILEVEYGWWNLMFIKKNPMYAELINDTIKATKKLIN